MDMYNARKGDFVLVHKVERQYSASWTEAMPDRVSFALYVITKTNRKGSVLRTACGHDAKQKGSPVDPRANLYTIPRARVTDTKALAALHWESHAWTTLRDAQNAIRQYITA